MATGNWSRKVLVWIDFIELLVCIYSIKHKMGANSLALAPAVAELSPSQPRIKADQTGHLFLFLLGHIPCLSESIFQ